MSELLRTPLYDWHAAHQGRLVEFGGWSMPVQYTSIKEEHLATRAAVGLFDVSHMGRFRLKGAGAAAFLEGLATRRVADMARGKIRYSLLTNEAGGILDDILIYRLEKEPGAEFFGLVVNAGNRAKIFHWLEYHLRGRADAQLTDYTLDTAMLAAQGPRALAAVRAATGFDATTLGYYQGRVTRVLGQIGVVSRTGYTGEDGCELIVPAGVAVELWERILAADPAAAPAGLGARDTLRLEAAMPLYGHELNEQVNPWQAGLAFAVNLKDREFVGRAALARLKDDARLPTRVGMALDGKRVPREHFAIFAADEAGVQRQVGEVTSGTYSPTLDKPIAMGFVPSACARVGQELFIDIRGRLEPARVVPLPFYQRQQG